MSHRQRTCARFLAEPRRKPSAIRAESGSGFSAVWARCVRAGSGVQKALVPFLAATLVLTALAGCDRLSRHQVMTFFFTGVPSLEEQDRMEAAAREEAKKPKQAKKSKETVAAASAKLERARSVAVRATRFSHGPYAANECYQCHEVSASGGFRGFGKQEGAAGSLAKAGIVPGKMVAPWNELCVGCHAGKKPEQAYRSALWVHGPVSNGYCIVCHAPHASPEPYLLLKKPDELCAECHAAGLIVNKAMHKDRADCTVCHNPHVGKDSRLLKAEHEEAW